MAPRFPGHAKVRRADRRPPRHRDNFEHRWLNSIELETVLQFLEAVGQDALGFDRDEARAVAFKSVQIAKAEFDRKIALRSPDCAIRKG